MVGPHGHHHAPRPRGVRQVAQIDDRDGSTMCFCDASQSIIMMISAWVMSYMTTRREMFFVRDWEKFIHTLASSLLGKICQELSSALFVSFSLDPVMFFSKTSHHDIIIPGLVCRYAGEFVSEILAGIKTPERKKENDNAEEGKQRAR